MNDNPAVRDFVVSYVGIGNRAPYEQEEILGYIWNAINSRVYDLIKDSLGEQDALELDKRYETEGESVLSDIRTRIEHFDELSKRATLEVLAEFKQIQKTLS